MNKFCTRTLFENKKDDTTTNRATIQGGVVFPNVTSYLVPLTTSLCPSTNRLCLRWLPGLAGRRVYMAGGL